MDARFEFVFACSPRDVRSCDLHAVQQAGIPFPVVDSTPKDREPKQEKPDA